MPDFYMLVGLPGSGKSTFAEQLAEEQNAVVFSSDAIRGELYGDESCQTDPARVFEILRARTIEAIKQGQSVIYDATNLSRKRRAALLNTLPACTKHCLIIWASVETCMQRDANRVRAVGEPVIKKMLLKFQTPNSDEGWDSIDIVYTDEMRYTLDYFNFDIAHANPHHTGTIKEHIDSVLALVERYSRGPHYNILKLLATYHDVGKVYARTFINSRGESTGTAHYYGHENAGAYICLGLAKDSNVTKEGKLFLSWLVNLHMEYHNSSQSKYYKKLPEVPQEILRLFGELDKLGK